MQFTTEIEPAYILFHAGTGLEFSVVDETNCSSGQTRVEQTQIVERNLHYDFNFQQANHLSKEIIVKPVWKLLSVCDNFVPCITCPTLTR